MLKTDYQTYSEKLEAVNIVSLASMCVVVSGNSHGEVKLNFCLIFTANCCTFILQKQKILEPVHINVLLSFVQGICPFNIAT